MPKVVDKMPIRKRAHGKYTPYMDGRVWRFDENDLEALRAANLEQLRRRLSVRASNSHQTSHTAMEGAYLFFQCIPKRKP